MFTAAETGFGECDIFIAAAAVSDYRPELAHKGKIKKNDTSMTLNLVRNPDILAEFSRRRKKGQLAIGFALETAGGLEYAQQKLKEKQLDLIAFNIYDGKTSGFEVDTNALTLINRSGEMTALPVMSKDAAARSLLDALESLLSPE
jgi:phosphopantothenoylcysteine decarboxylase/phosphopantothenate--cysteine ligase